MAIFMTASLLAVRNDQGSVLEPHILSGIKKAIELPLLAFRKYLVNIGLSLITGSLP
jgi:hypothetical protein